MVLQLGLRLGQTVGVWPNSRGKPEGAGYSEMRGCRLLGDAHVARFDWPDQAQLAVGLGLGLCSSSLAHALGD